MNRLLHAMSHAPWSRWWLVLAMLPALGCGQDPVVVANIELTEDGDATGSGTSGTEAEDGGAAGGGAGNAGDTATGSGAGNGGAAGDAGAAGGGAGSSADSCQIDWWVPGLALLVDNDNPNRCRIPITQERLREVILQLQLQFPLPPPSAEERDLEDCDVTGAWLLPSPREEPTEFVLCPTPCAFLDWLVTDRLERFAACQEAAAEQQP